MKPVRTIGVVSGGSDAPGLNPVNLRRLSLIVAADGVKVPATCSKPIPSTGSESVANTIAHLARTPQKEIQVTVQGHVQPGGLPGPFDRILGTCLGVAASDLAAQQRFGRTVCLKSCKIDSVTLDEAIGKIVDPASESAHAARTVAATFGVSA